MSNSAINTHHHMRFNVSYCLSNKFKLHFQDTFLQKKKKKKERDKKENLIVILKTKKKKEKRNGNKIYLIKSVLCDLIGGFQYKLMHTVSV